MSRLQQTDKTWSHECHMTHTHTPCEVPTYHSIAEELHHSVTHQVPKLWCHMMSYDVTSMSCDTLPCHTTRGGRPLYVHHVLNTARLPSIQSVEEYSANVCTYIWQRLQPKMLHMYSLYVAHSSSRMVRYWVKLATGGIVLHWTWEVDTVVGLSGNTCRQTR